MRSRATSLLAAVCGLLVSVSAQADYFVVVNASNPQKALTQKEAIALFMGRNRAFQSGEIASVYDLPRDHPRRAEFYQALTGLTVTQVNSYWSRLMFSGQSVPPQTLADESAMASMLHRNPAALGWLSKEPSDPGLRVVLVVKDAR